MPSSEAAEKERLLKHEEAAKALGKPIYDDMKGGSFVCFYYLFPIISTNELAAFANMQIFVVDVSFSDTKENNNMAVSTFALIV
ncbi:unnamed protein product [Acanthocheilonema viteae]|uniref:Uncharacterized protein n=1 Tax=Acanthocheilonema viteae TaxID=6277 RepID=A0A498SNH3_ACAVI|nr:unnamed protein product [Acanthocheilonema viteae]